MDLNYLWTALPNGAGNGKLYLSVYATPHIDDPSDLTKEPLVNWPAAILGTQFVACFQDAANAATPVAARPASVVPTQLRPELWLTLFGDLKGDPLRAARYTPLATAQNVVSIPVTTAHGALQGVYRAAGTGPRSARVAAVVSAVSGQQSVFETIAAFHRFPSIAARPTQQAPAGKPSFYEILNGITHYPTFLRLLGLVVDLEVDDAASIPVNSHVWIQTSGTIDVNTSKLKTICTIERSGGVGSAFYANPDPAYTPEESGPPQYRGLLGLKQYDLITVDTDSGSVKAAEISSRRRSDNDPADGPVQNKVPALRSIGIALVRKDDAQFRTGQAGQELYVRDRLARSKALTDQMSAKQEIGLYSEDLLKGFAVDVKRDNQDWRTLCARQGECVIGPHRIQIDDEGLVSNGGSTIPGDDKFKVSPALFRWDGFSLAIARSSRGVPAPRQNSGTGATTDLGFRVNLRAKGLHKLRFQSMYQFRVRRKDLAGNGLTLKAANDVVAASAIAVSQGVIKTSTFLRFENIAPPVILARDNLVSGDSVTALVIRSSGDPPGTTGGRRGLANSRSWHLLPPAVSMEISELSGAYDQMEALDVYNDVGSREGVLPGVADSTYLEANEVRHAGPLYVPYIPDPQANSVVLESSRADWPKTSPTSAFPLVNPIIVEPGSPRRGLTKLSRILRMVSGEDKLEVAQEDDGIRVVLPPAESVELLLRSVPSQSGVYSDHFALSTWAGTDDETTAELVSPPRRAVLVHAVERPLRPLAITRKSDGSPTLIASRDLFQKIAAFEGTASLHLKSTASVTCEATWTDTIDDGTSREWVKKHGIADLFTKAVEDHSGDAANTGASEFGITGQHAFVDTKHRALRCRLRSNSRFTEFFPPTTPVNSDRFVRTSEYVDVVLPNGSPPLQPNVLWVLPTFERRKPCEGTAERLGHSVRVYLSRGDWYTSGNGEQLAVLLAATIQGQDTSFYQACQLSDPNYARCRAIERAYTQWGVDPILRSAPTRDYPVLDDFITDSKARGLKTTITYQDPSAGQPVNVAVPVNVAAFDVHISEDASRLYCDISLRPTAAYFPFVRLSLARYQSHSTPGAELSVHPVQADLVQLFPNRVLVVSKQPANMIRVAVFSDSFPGAAQSGDSYGAITYFVTIQRRWLGWLGFDHWHDVGREVILVPAQDSMTGLLCSIDIAIPDPKDFRGDSDRPHGGFEFIAKHRVVVHEIERLAADAVISDQPSGVPRMRSQQQTQTISRIVYAEELEF